MPAYFALTRAILEPYQSQLSPRHSELLIGKWRRDRRQKRNGGRMAQFETAPIHGD